MCIIGPSGSGKTPPGWTGFSFAKPSGGGLAGVEHERAVARAVGDDADGQLVSSQLDLGGQVLDDHS
jgi:hypothetical protein